MAATITEKILADAAHMATVRPGQIIEAPVDLALANDVTAPLGIEEFEKAGFDRVFDPNKIVLVPDHFMPNKDIKAATQAKKMREFARKHGIKQFFEVGRMGIEHALLPELGMVAPGDIVVGADSHTCTYGALALFSTGIGSTDFAAAMAWGRVWLRVPESIKFVYHGRLSKYVTGKDLILHTIGRIGVDGALYKAMEFTGPAIDHMSIEGRLTMCNMAIEAGGKAGIVGYDATTAAFLASRPEGSRARTAGQVFASDPDADYSEVIEIDAATVPLTVARPHLPANTAAAEDLSAITIDQVVIGSCTNGRLEDLRQAASVLRGRKVHPNVRAIVLPGTQQVCLDAAKDGTLQTLIEAGFAFSTPTCGPCLGAHLGVLAAGERAVSTTNRNFVGRMGDVTSEVYLASPYVAAASAIAGHIATPQMVSKDAATTKAGAAAKRADEVGGVAERGPQGSGRAAQGGQR
jgi:3-isopropylmalate/(R)-2-methylmalate dehydratase large subunit